jgi:sugar/nucleoside kinase (ribokinase family)
LAASFFTKPRVAGVIGRDFPRKALSFLRSHNIDLQGVRVKPGKTFHWEGRYGLDPNIRTTVRTDLNVYGDFAPRLPEAFRRPSILFLANFDPDRHEGVFSQLKERPKITAMDTIKFWIETRPEALRRELRRTDVYFANDEEVKMLSGESNLIKAGKKVLESGPSLLVVKKGEHGAIVFGRDFLFGVPAHPCEEVIDPTGAGDCFAGGFLGYLEKANAFSRDAIRRAAVYGTVLASFAIEDFGIGRLAGLEPKDIECRYRLLRRLVSF